MLEKRRSEYNDRIAHFRKSEYPMLKGKLSFRSYFLVLMEI
jgi:hypothetical protein